MTTTTLAVGQSLVHAQLFRRLVRRVEQDHGLAAPTAERVVDQALAFLAALSERSDLRPSEMVDLGWHAFLLHTREYADFCLRVGSGFIHHEPDDPGTTPVACATIDETMAAIAACGYAVDHEMWGHPAKCGEVGCGGGRPPCNAVVTTRHTPN